LEKFIKNGGKGEEVRNKDWKSEPEKRSRPL